MNRDNDDQKKKRRRRKVEEAVPLADEPGGGREKGNIEKIGDSASKAELVYVKTVLEQIREYDLASAVRVLKKISAVLNQWTDDGGNESGRAILVDGAAKNTCGANNTNEYNDSNNTSSTNGSDNNEPENASGSNGSDNINGPNDTDGPTPPQRSKTLQTIAYGGIQFRSTVRHARPGTALDRVEIRRLSDATFQPVLWVNFIGVAGIQGPLPTIYTDRAFRNIRNKDYALASFLDVFNHRVVHISYDMYKWIPGHSMAPPGASALGDVILALAGIAPGGARYNPAAHSANEQSSLYFITYKTLFWKRIRSASALKQMLINFFKVYRVPTSEVASGGARESGLSKFIPLDSVDVHITEYRATPVSVPSKYMATLGTSRTLGKDIFLGNRVWRYNKIVEITILNIPDVAYESFNCFSNGENWRHLRQMVTKFLPSNIKVRYFVQANADAKKLTILGHSHNLGFNTWLGVDGSSNVRLRVCAQ
ncbi:MAG: type VI secretion system baseplate subunit TssG [Holosporales bacterium]|jgi:type VI secretion system protein ImpH|nr:type VI secretion system baseplate subunit TssG [Holosporales bacterium]